MIKKRFDIVFSNPPYTRGTDLKIIKSLYNHVEEMVIVHPSTWLIDLKGISKLFNDTKEYFGISIKSATLFNGNPVFGIGLFVPCVIIHINTNKNIEELIDVEYFGRKFKAESVYDITKFGPEWKTIVEPFMKTVKQHIKKSGSVWDYNVKEVAYGKHYCQLAAIRGNVYTGNGGTDIIVQDDFYTLVMRDSEKNKGIRNTKTTVPIIYQFSIEAERNNFIEYLKTYFVRFCLAILKVNQHTDSGEMSLIPWLDFTQEWNDDRLFEYFNISKQTQHYIKTFLPNYYSIKKG